MNESAYEIPAEGKVMACLDVSVYTHPVTDYAAWASKRLTAGLVCLHVLDRKSATPAEPDYSGTIGIDAGSHLLDELAELDARQNRLAMQRGRALLQQAVARASDAGAVDAELLQRYGPLAQALTELEHGVRLFVLGKRGEAADFNKGHLGANLERVVRAVHRPTLVTSREFRPVRRFAVAFDGSPTSQRCIDVVTMSPLLKGLDCRLIVAGKSTRELSAALDRAATRLKQAGYEPQIHFESGEAERIITEQIALQEIDLLVMGAYGHSRIRHLMVGSTTTTILRSCTIPVLLLR